MAKKRDIEIDESPSSAEATEGEARVYELGFHLDPELPTEEVKKAYQAVRDMIAKQGDIVAEGSPVKIQLAYTISRQETTGRRDFNSAYFSWIVYEASPDKHAEVVAAANADKRIIRFVDLVTTKEAARHALEVRELAMKAAEKESAGEGEEETGEAELDAALEHVEA